VALVLGRVPKARELGRGKDGAEQQIVTARVDSRSASTPQATRRVSDTANRPEVWVRLNRIGGAPLDQASSGRPPLRFESKFVGGRAPIGREAPT